jgi:hypothetical protein
VRSGWAAPLVLLTERDREAGSQHLGSDEHAQQMSRLKEMIVDTRQAYEKAGVTFTPIVNYPVD